MKWPRVPALGIKEILALQAAGIMLFAWLTRPPVTNVDLYFRVSELILEGKIPYRDFPFEYPPLSFVPILLPRVVTFFGPIRIQDYYKLTLFFTVLWTVGTGLCVASIGRALDAGGREPSSRGAVSYVAIYSALAVIIATMMGWVYDSFPALLATIGFTGAVRKRPAIAGVFLGLGVVAKIYPVFLLALFAAYYLALGDRRAFFRLVAASCAAMALVMVPFRLLAPEQWLSFLTYHRDRGFEIGSTVAAALWLGKLFGVTSVTTEHNYGAEHVVSPIADALLPWATPFLFLAMAGILLAYLVRFRKEKENRRAVSFNSLGSATMVVLLVFLITNKVFSPQYIVWVIPLVPFLPGRAIALSFAIAGLTTYVYAFHWFDLLDGRAVPTLALNLRNVLVIVLVLQLWYSCPHHRMAENRLGPARPPQG
jgi:hypothetical protein